MATLTQLPDIATGFKFLALCMDLENEAGKYTDNMTCQFVHHALSSGEIPAKQVIKDLQHQIELGNREAMVRCFGEDLVLRIENICL